MSKRRKIYFMQAVFIMLLGLISAACTSATESGNEDEAKPKIRPSFLGTVIKPWGLYQIRGDSFYVVEVYANGWVEVIEKPRSRGARNAHERGYLNLNRVMALKKLRPAPSRMPEALSNKLERAGKLLAEGKVEEMARLLFLDQAFEIIVDDANGWSDEELRRLSRTFFLMSRLGVIYKSDKHQSLEVYDPLRLSEGSNSFTFVKIDGQWVGKL